MIKKVISSLLFIYTLFFSFEQSLAVKEHICDYPMCGATLSSARALTYHKRTHTGERPFICDYPECAKSFAQSGALTVHKRTHIVGQSLICDYPGCTKTFTSLGSLNRHKKAHTKREREVDLIDSADTANLAKIARQ